MILQVKNLKTYFLLNKENTVKAVDGINFLIEDEETVGLLGESGSGKTVTALSIMRLISHPGEIGKDSSIKFKGKEMLFLDEFQMQNIRGKEISLVFQDPLSSLNPVLSIRYQMQEVISSHLKVGKTLVANILRNTLHKLDFEYPDNILNSYPHKLSGGQRQRIAIAISLLLNPKLLILDEPTTSLDVTVAARILNLIKKLKKEFKFSILFITHDLAILKEIADRIIIMKDGKIIEEGSCKNIISNPTSDYTKELLAASFIG